MNMFQVLEVSTGHVTQRDMELMAERGHDSDFPLTVASDRYSTWLTIPAPGEGIEEKIIEAGLSESVCKVIRFTQKQDLLYVRLDRDGELIEGESELDSHDW